MSYLRFLLLFFFLTHGKVLQLHGEERIEPGDKVHLRIIGVVDETYEVDTEGFIDFDLWGKVQVTNLNKEETINTIKRELNKYILFDEKPIFLSIKKKPIIKHDAYISVFGEVRGPGSYPARPGLKVLDYIVLSGGTTRFALTDSIKVICFQDGKSLSRDFNMQRFSAGSPTEVPPVSSGCMIYVPEKPAEKASWLRNLPDQVIHIFGQVNKPGRYEFSEDYSFMDILSHAGGITVQADMSKLSIISDERVRVFNLSAFLRDGGSVPHLHTGDVVFVPQRQEVNKSSWMDLRTKHSIYLLGEFNKPGRYEFDRTFSFMDIISHAGGPKSSADIKHFKIIRNNKIIGVFNLNNYHQQQGVLPPELLPEDVIYLPPTSNNRWIDQAPTESIYLLGEFNKPGRYEFDQSLNFLDIVSQAGGPKNTADIKRFTIIRQNKRLGVFDFHAYQKKRGDSLPALLPEDLIYLPSIDPTRWIKNDPTIQVNILGEVRQPGRYEVEGGNLNFIDILASAAGPSSNADLANIKIIHRNQTLNGDYQVLTKRITEFDFIEFQKTDNLSSLPQIFLGDTIMIPPLEKNFWEEFKTIGGALGVIVLMLALSQ